jgi:tRNA(Ile)-lysidine synthase
VRPAGADLARRFVDSLHAHGDVNPGDGVVVALSGGADSVVLLHLLRFAPGGPDVSLSAVHVDHAMRRSSEGDARWVRGLCSAWDVPLEMHRLDPAPRTEAGAREARYAALEAARNRLGARWVATAHHADDQAETVLFRAARGTGLAGLRGIARRRSPGVWRPLLSFRRSELRGYAEAHGLAWREDPTNVLPLARNLIRSRVLPALTEAVGPGVAWALADLARRAASAEAAWRSLEAGLLEQVDARGEPGGHSVERAGLLALHPGVAGRVLRALARRAGSSLGESGTRRGVEFIRSGRSGAWIPLTGDLTLRRELDRLVVARREEGSEDVEVVVDGRQDGAATACLGGSRYRLSWRVGVGPPAEGEWSARLADLVLPLRVRGWRPGDRVRLAYGSKKLKKVLLEARIPSARRRSLPVVVDAAGAVLWVPGVVAAATAAPGPETNETLTIGIVDAQPD